MFFKIIVSVFLFLDTLLVLMLYKYLQLKGIIEQKKKKVKKVKDNEIKKG